MTHYLPIGHTIQDHDHSCEYTIKGVLGRGASTIAYLADYSDGSGCVSERIIKECYPSSISITRNNDGALAWAAHDAEKYEAALAYFIAGGESQNDLRKSTGLVNSTPPLQRIFKANNTCYFDVIPFEGRTFDKFETFTLLERLRICLATAKVLNQYHSKGKLYLDLKPENIFVLTDPAGEVVTDLVVLIDFDSVIDKDKVKFGNSLSFTKAWAAPEQINPHAFRKISEATDIYAIGELVFWSVFGRHSTEEEHRGFSEYPFDNSIRKTIQQTLARLFRNTIRSSPRNRFSTIQPVVQLLELITEELTKKEFIVARDIVPKSFFLGRSRELNALTQAMKNDKIVFVTGLAGIGKSEVVKWFAHNNQARYDSILYWTYDGSLVTMVCDNSSVSISRFSQYADEEDEVYAKRKLIKLSSLLTPNSLIIIDNIDILISEFDSPALWSQILALPGRIIISSRCYEKEFTCIEINELDDIDLLRTLFLKYCPSAVEDESQLVYIDRIISIAGRHTYEIELLAVYTEEKMQSPQKTLLEMEQEGFSALNGASLSVQKDGDYSGASFMEHFEKLLSMSKLSANQRQLLLKLSFIPAIGISLRDFTEYYGIGELHDLRWLIKHSFVADTGTQTHILTVHPAVADVVISTAKINDTLVERFYCDALTAMRRGYDDPSVNQSFYERACQYLDSRQFLDLVSTQNNQSKSEDAIRETVMRLRNDFAARYAKSSVSSAVYSQMCSTIAEKTIAYRLQHKLAAQYTTQYVEWFSKYGHDKKQLAIIQYALQIYNKQTNDTYCPDLEYACAVYADLAARLSDDYSSTIALCKEHLVLARKSKDWSMASYWCINLAKLCLLMGDFSTFKYQLKYGYYSMRSLWQNQSLRERFDNSFTPNTTKLNIRFAELNESMYEFYPPSDPRMMKRNLQNAIREREKALDKDTKATPTNNSVMIAIDQARISILGLDFEAAKQILSATLEPYCSGQHLFSVAAKHAAELLGDVYTVVGDYKSAVDWYHTTLHISDSIGEYNPCITRIKLGRAYNLLGSEIAKQHNYAIWEEMKDISSDSLQRYVADAYYNVGDYHYTIGEVDTSEHYINDALVIYEAGTHHRLHNNIGRSRCYERLARINHIRGEATIAIEFAKTATSLLAEILGDLHPEVIEFRHFLSTLQE